MALQQVVEQTVSGLNYELVEIARTAGGLLRITIDLPWSAGQPEAAQQPQAGLDAERYVGVEDCEKVTRQLQYALEVEGVEYTRLEVSSPGIDRLLRGQQDFERFAGSVVDITLKAPLGASAQGMVNAKRKKFRGRLERAEPAQAAPPSWRIVWSDAPAVKPGQRVSKKRPPPPEQVLEFTLDEVREARLAPIVNFKGRAAGAPASALPGADESV